ncbi:MAG: hypothetical protein JWM43_2045 [Acidobacteriaceae bacterium]|nr:hypothetical protein [Acidobacteriaceae bacterium]
MRDVLELAVGYGLILAVAWTRGAWQQGLYLVAIVWVVGAVALRFEGWRWMGLRVAGLLRSLWVVGIALAVALVAVMLAQWFDTLNRPEGAALFVKTFWSYAVWSLVQQFLLQVFVLLRLVRLFPQRRRLAIALAAGMFAVVHLPNPLLTCLTLAWGVGACWLFLRYRNVYTLGITHAILGVCVAIVVPGHLDHNMRVGRGYLEYQPYGANPLTSGGRRHASDAWVMADDPLRSSAGESQH